MNAEVPSRRGIEASENAFYAAPVISGENTDDTNAWIRTLVTIMTLMTDI
jgi:hypothetical protein